jgi:capsular polysaccharide biosynthesis protein
MMKLIDWAQLVRGLLRRSWLIILLVVAATAVGVLGSIKYGQVQYEARASLLYRTKNQKQVPSVSGSQLVIRELARNTAVSLLRRTANLETVLTNLNVSMRPEELGWRVGTQSEKQSEIILLRVEYLPSAKLAISMANELARVALEDNRNFYQSQARQFAEQSERLASEAAKTLEISRDQLTAFQTAHQMLEVAADTKAFLDSMGAISERLHLAKNAYDSQLVRIENYKKMISKLPEEVLSQAFEDNPIKRRIANTEVALMEARTKYGADNPRVLLMEDNLKEMRRTMNSKSYDETRERVYVANPVKREFETELLRLEAERQVLEQTVQQVEKQLAEVEKRYANLPKLQLDLAGFLQRHTSAQAQVLNFQTAAHEARMAVSLDMADFEILEPARSATAVRSKIARVLPVLFFVVALFGGIVLCLLLEFLDPRLKTTRQVEQAYTIPCLATIPIIRSVPLAEAFLPVCRALYQRLAVLAPKEGALSLSILSAGAGEGKSTLGFLLARYWAGLGVSTAYLDFDVAPNPLLHPPANLAGLDDYLAGQATWDVISFKQDNVVCFKRLEDVGDLPERLHGTAMRRLMDTLSAQYGCVIIDTPACGVDESAPLLARLTGYPIFVIKASDVPRATVNTALDDLERVGVRPLGIVLNFSTIPTDCRAKGGQA